MSGHPGTRANTEEIMATIAGETETPLARLNREAAEAKRRRREVMRRIANLAGQYRDLLKKHGRTPWDSR